MEFTGERFVPHLTEEQIKIEHLQRYFAITELVKGKMVLDAACGEGYGSSILSETAAKVIGIDISTEAIDHARNSYENENLSFQVASIGKLPFENQSVDVVVSFETIEHVEEMMQKSFLSEIKRVLKENGLLIISTPNKHMYSDIRNYHNPFHIKEFYKEEYSQFLRNYFEFVNIFHQKNEVSSVITDFSNNENMRQVKIDNEKTDINGTYFIAVCSDKELSNHRIGSSVLFADKYNEMLNRILSLQDEVEEKNAHIKLLDANGSELQNELNNQKNVIIDLQAKTIQLQEKVIITLDENLLLKQEIERRLNDSDEILRRLGVEYGIQDSNLDEIIRRVNHDLKLIRDRDQEIQNKDQELKNKEGHINLLLESDRSLEKIHRSTGWKLLTKYYRLRDKLIPKSSRRRLAAKLVSKSIKEPRKMIKSFNKTNLKKLRYYLNTEDVGNIESRIDHYMDRHKEVSQLKIKLVDSNEMKEKFTFPQFESPLVSIVIPVYNQWEYTYSCLKSITLNTEGIAYEIIIADDMSTDETINISSYIENIHVVRDGVNRGFLLNCNNAAKRARGEYIFFLNNDTNVQENWLKYLVDLVENNSKIGMVGSKLVYPDGRLQEAGGIIWNDASGWNYGRLDDPSKPEYNYVKEVDFISGAAIMIRTELWKEIGGFDERYVPAYYEDADLAFEVRKHGYQVVLEPKSIVVHFEGISHGTNTFTGIKAHQVVNKERFLDKWKEVLEVDHFTNAEHVFNARDRSKDKKTILVIDHYVPHFDKDAGGRCVFLYLKLFKQMGFHVIFVGDNFYKHEPYTSILEEMGIEVLYGNWYQKHIFDWIKNNGTYLHYAYLIRPHISIKYIETIKKHSNAKVFFFGTDLHYVRELRNYELTKDEEMKKMSEYWREIEFELFSKTDVIHVVGSYEERVLQEENINKPIRNIPLYIYDEDQFGAVSNKFSEREGILFVGGFGHKPNQDAVLWFVKYVFPQFLLEYPDLNFYIVGSNPTEEIKNLRSHNIHIVGYVSDEELLDFYNRVKIVVVPLRFGAGIKGKVLEAMFNQVPLITTPIGAEGLDRVDEFVQIVNNESEFVQSFSNLYGNEHAWEETAGKSQKYILENFSIESAKKQLLKDMNP
ncbi:glycosyltransferase [Paenibacillus sp. Soil750]|uniref:glycosyltransferase n=1 Tax=Paenibacillus sp. Soil750 TaxID=1736398 RepID=UPI0006F3BDB8|nr:glycosyltransferase [Paenibacillus sp. Soil750]KRE75408.1 glycosyl transferase family 2 [Paenibacillus sp. Soil750]